MAKRGEGDNVAQRPGKHRADGWTNPRDESRDPEPYDPSMDRHAIGTNVPQQRKGGQS